MATPRGRPWAMVGASRSQLAALHWHPFDMVVQGQLQLKTRFETRSNLRLSQRRGQSWRIAQDSKAHIELHVVDRVGRRSIGVTADLLFSF